MAKSVRPRLDEQDIRLLKEVLSREALQEKNLERKWKLLDLRTRLEAPKRGHPRILTMERISDLHYEEEQRTSPESAPVGT